MPAYPTIDTYGPVVAVKDFTVVNGACVFSKPRDAAEPAHKASQ